MNTYSRKVDKRFEVIMFVYMKTSAGILAYRLVDQLEVFLVHPGGPFFKNKDIGAWSIPKGEYLPDEDPLIAAKREFYEETGYQLAGAFTALKPVKQKGGKQVMAWAIEQSIDAANIKSNTFNMEWPPGRGNFQTFPEVDKAAWFTADAAREKIISAQALFIDELLEKLKL